MYAGPESGMAGSRCLPNRCRPYGDMPTRTCSRSEDEKAVRSESLRAWTGAKYSGSCSGGGALVGFKLLCFWVLGLGEGRGGKERKGSRHTSVCVLHVKKRLLELGFDLAEDFEGFLSGGMGWS